MRITEFKPYVRQRTFQSQVIEFTEDLIKAMAIVKKAAATANMEVELLNPRLGEVICRASDEIIQGQWHDQFIIDPIQGGAGTSINMNTNEVIANRAIEILGEKKGELLSYQPKHAC